MPPDGRPERHTGFLAVGHLRPDSLAGGEFTRHQFPHARFAPVISRSTPDTSSPMSQQMIAPTNGKSGRPKSESRPNSASAVMTDKTPKKAAVLAIARCILADLQL